MAGRSTCGTVMLMAGVVFTILTVIFVAISFGTDYWLKFTVDRSELDTSLKTADAIKKNGRYTFSRNRGLFRECYPGNDTSGKNGHTLSRRQFQDGVYLNQVHFFKLAHFTFYQVKSKLGL